MCSLQCWGQVENNLVDLSSLMKPLILQWVMRTVQRQMMAVARAEFMAVESELWAALDNAITLRECEIYSYNPGKLPHLHQQQPLPVKYRTKQCPT